MLSLPQGLSEDISELLIRCNVRSGDNLLLDFLSNQVAVYLNNQERCKHWLLAKIYGLEIKPKHNKDIQRLEDGSMLGFYLTTLHKETCNSTGVWESY